MPFEYRSIYRNIYIYVLHSFQFTWAWKTTWLLSFFWLYIPPGSYDGIIRIHDIRISIKQPGFPMESLWVFFRKLHLFPVFILVLGRGGKVFGKSLATLKSRSAYKRGTNWKDTKTKKPLDLFFPPDLISVIFFFVFFESVIQDAHAESIHLLAKFYAPGCIDPGWFLFIYSIIIFGKPWPIPLTLLVSNVHLLWKWHRSMNLNGRLILIVVVLEISSPESVCDW